MKTAPLYTPQRDAICGVIAARPWICQRDIARVVGLCDSTVGYHLHQLRKAGVILRERRGRAVLHRLTGVSP